MAALRLKVAEQLEHVVTGVVSPDAALREFESLDFLQDRLANDAWHSLVHFRDDEDISVREPTYREYQREGLRRWVERLRGEP